MPERSASNITSEEAPPQSSPPPDGDRATKRSTTVLQYVGLPLVAGILLFARETYYDGYAAALGIPDDLAFEPRVSLFELLAWALGLSYALFLAFAFARRQLQLSSMLAMRTSHRIVTSLMALPFVASAVAIWMLKPEWQSNALVALLATGALILLLASWADLLPRHPIARGYMAAFRGIHDAGREAGSRPPSGAEVVALLVRLGGWPAVLVLIAVIGMPVLSYQAGKYRTSRRTNWTTLEASDLPRAADVRWVVLGWQGERLLVAPVRDRIVQPEFRYVTATATSVLRPTILGELSPASTVQSPTRETTQGVDDPKRVSR